jgi:hypothetical protein
MKILIIVDLSVAIYCKGSGVCLGSFLIRDKERYDTDGADHTVYMNRRLSAMRRDILDKLATPRILYFDTNAREIYKRYRGRSPDLACCSFDNTEDMWERWLKWIEFDESRHFPLVEYDFEIGRYTPRVLTRSD